MNLFIATPSYNGDVSAELLPALLNGLPRMPWTFQPLSSSFLTRTFNELWCMALNENSDYFLMVHADIVPTSPNWGQVMLDTLRAQEADALAVIMPIKDDLGLTSFALTQNGNSNQRRLTLKECHHRLPETFDAHTCAHVLDAPHDSMLLLNTGLFLVDLKRHRSEIEQLVFRTRNVIDKGADGTFRTWAWSEDWYWSRDAHNLGLRLVATRAVQAMHRGSRRYCNCCDWGTLTEDNNGAYMPDPEVRPNAH